MRRLFTAACAVLALALAAPAAEAQQTTGNITGRVLDAQGAAVPGVTVTAKNPETGFTRTDVSDAEGIYRLTALPVGTYDITAELQGSRGRAARASSSTSARRSTSTSRLKVASAAARPSRSPARRR